MSKTKTKKIEIPEDAKVYDFAPVIEICGKCGGTGEMDVTKPLADNILYRLHENVCPVCLGSGRVVKTKTVIIDIKTYYNNDEPQETIQKHNKED